MTPYEFIAKWSASELKEPSASHQHFLDLCELLDEPVAGYPKRPVPSDEAAAKALKKRTLTNLYNARPQWLADAHATLEAAVAAAYGWSAGISDDEVLRELLALNGGRQ